jgi:hypothetical protein
MRYGRSQETPRLETELKPLSEEDLTEKQCPNQRLRLLYIFVILYCLLQDCLLPFAFYKIAFCLLQDCLLPLSI